MGYENNHLGKKMLALISGLVLAAGSGAAVLTHDGKMIAKTPQEPLHKKETANVRESSQQKVYAAAQVEQSAVMTLTSVELPKSQKQKKAKLDDYTMLLQYDKVKSLRVIKKKDEKSESKKTTEEIPQAAPEEITVETTQNTTEEPAQQIMGETQIFEASYQSDNTTVYDPKPDPLNFKLTRSVEKEFFTVNDIISGGTYTMNAHELLCEMVYSEIGSEWGDEAIKAQAVAAYSYLRFCDESGVVPDIGLKQGYPQKIDDLISSVEGQAVFYNERIIDAVYSASTAGYSVESERIWSTDYPYLRCVVSEYDNEDPYYDLQTTFSRAEVKSKLESACGIIMSDDVEKWFQMEDIYSGKYVGYINVDGQSRITCRKLQDTFDLKSQAVTITIDGDNVTFHTYGWGHGVGMSQWGACLYAKHGWTYDQILRHYYLNTTVGLSVESAKAVERGK